MKVLHIKWQDACSIGNWISSDEFNDKPKEIESIGFISKETDDAYWLSNSKSIEDDGDNLFACTMVIPKKMVLSVKETNYKNITFCEPTVCYHEWEAEPEPLPMASTNPRLHVANNMIKCKKCGEIYR